MTFIETIGNSKAFLIGVFKWWTDTTVGDVSVSFMDNGTVETITYPNAKKSTQNNAIDTLLSGETTYEYDTKSRKTKVTSGSTELFDITYDGDTTTIIAIKEKVTQHGVDTVKSYTVTHDTNNNPILTEEAL